MPFVYNVQLATAGNTATHATPNTETGVVRHLPGARSVSLRSIYLIGKCAALTAISGIAIRVARFTTGSTVGTGATPRPRDVNAPAATTVCGTGQTLGSGRTEQLVIGCGVAGPGGWAAQNDDAAINQQGSATSTVDLISASATASLNFEWSSEIQES